MRKVTKRMSRALLFTLLVVTTVLSMSIPAFAEKAVAADKLVQCDNVGTVTSHTAITGVNLPVVFDNNTAYTPISVDAGIFSGGSSVKELTGLTSSNLKISLGAVTNYDYNTVYEIKYRAHYIVVGEGTEIIEEWKSTDLYFKVEAAAVSAVATLDSLKVGGSAVSGFDPAVITYNVELPYGTKPGSAAATVGATASDSKAAAVITQATALPGSATITVTAEDKTTTKAYTVNFTLGAATTHTVSVSNDGNGTGNADFASAAKGTAVTLSSAPSSGYHFKEWQAITPAALSITSSTFTMPDEAVIVKAVFEADAATDCTVTFYNGSAVYAAKTVASGGSIGNTSWPANPTKSGYTFNGWYTGENGSGSKFTSGTAVTSNITVYAYWIKNSSESSSSGGSADSGTTIKMTTADGVTTVSAEVTGSIGSDGTGTASVTQKQMQDAVDSAVKEAAAKGTKAVVTFSVDTDDSATGISVSIPQAAIKEAADSGIHALEVTAPQVSLSFDSAALASISKNADGAFVVKAVKASDMALSDADKTLIGSRPIYALSLTSGGTTLSSFGGGKATVSIPYTLVSGEDANKIVIYYISGSGALVTVPDCVYDASTGTVTFATTHFSNYAVGYNDVSFTDVSGWYTDYVSYLAARGIIGGTGDGKFSPDANISRAEFVTILARMSGDELIGYTSSSFSDVATTDWYFAAVQWANKAGIASGYDGKFNPNETITREQMAAMLYRYAEYKGTVTNTEGMSVREFSDYASISSWAQAPIQWAMNNKILSGNSDGSFAPQSSATRAQAAKMLAVLMQGMIK